MLKSTSIFSNKLYAETNGVIFSILSVKKDMTSQQIYEHVKELNLYINNPLHNEKGFMIWNNFIIPLCYSKIVDAWQHRVVYSRKWKLDADFTRR